MKRPENMFLKNKIFFLDLVNFWTLKILVIETENFLIKIIFFSCSLV